MSILLQPSVIICTISFFSIIWLSILEIKEILFYWSKNWDYTEDSGVCGFKMYDGESLDDRNITSNRDRVVFGLPFIILILVTFFLISLRAIFEADKI